MDSVAALVPKAEIDGEMGDSHVGLQARLMSQALRKLTSVISRSNCVVVFINQLRDPSAMSRLKDPVGIVSTFICALGSPSFITAPLPYCIWWPRYREWAA